VVPGWAAGTTEASSVCGDAATMVGTEEGLLKLARRSAGEKKRRCGMDVPRCGTLFGAGPEEDSVKKTWVACSLAAAAGLIIFITVRAYRGSSGFLRGLWGHRGSGGGSSRAGDRWAGVESMVSGTCRVLLNQFVLTRAD